MTRRTRLFAAIAAVALLFSQLAVAVHACPMAMPSAAVSQDECDEAMMSANLCRSHCDYASASFEAAKPLPVPPLAILAGLKVALPDVAVSSMPASATRVAPGPSPPPPLSRFTVLRL